MTTLNNHSTESDSQTAYDRDTMGEGIDRMKAAGIDPHGDGCGEPAGDDTPLIVKLLNDYSPKEFADDISDYILSEEDDVNADLQKALKDAVWWDTFMLKSGARTTLVDVHGSDIAKLADIGRFVLKQLYANTEGK